MSETSKLPEADGQVSDAPKGNWVDTLAPAWSRPYLRLSRADRPIGTWLLLIPCLWGAFLASASQGGFSARTAWVVAACAMGAWLMRGAGCTWNDITDRKFDAMVERTRSRPLPAGQVTVRQAIIWMGVQMMLAFGLLLTFNLPAILLGVSSLLLVAVYPFAKRFTWWPQVFLGLAFNWGAILAWVAITGELHWAAIALYLAGISWTLFYDTIYAHQDKDDDALIGVKSTARLFGTATQIWLRWFLIISVALLALAVILALAPTGSGLALLVALTGVWLFGWHLAWQNATLDTENSDICLKLFRSNRNAGLIPALFIAGAMFL